MTEPAADAGRSSRIADERMRKRLAELAHFARQSLVRELAASIAHEINQPLGAIAANVEALKLLLHSPTPDLTEAREIAADVWDDTQRAADVVQCLLSKKPSLQLKNVDLAEPVRDTVHFLSALAVDAQISSSFAPTPLPVKVDVVQLHQAIMSVITNATDAMADLPVDKRKVLVATERTGNSARVSITDRGPGVPPDQHKEIFAPFFSTKRERMGMGLSIARTIIEAHGGRISVGNVPAEGAVFHILLPLATSTD